MRWLQLCDIHLGTSDENQNIAMNQLVEVVHERTGNTPIDAVVFAGDIAYSGKENEYTTVLHNLVQPLRNIGSLSNAKFISVPGNHDLDCDTTHPIVWSSLGESRQSAFWHADENGKKMRNGRAPGFSAYSRFLTQGNIEGPDPMVEIGSIVPVANECSVKFICLNTAWFSDKALSEDQEKGISPLPVHTLRQLASDARESNIQLIVLGHHPLGWFDIRSRNQFQSVLNDHGAIYIHGHEHCIEPIFGPAALRSLGFAASYPARLDGSSRQPYTSTFAICLLDEQLHTQFVSWDPQHGAWRPNFTVSSDIMDRSKKLDDAFAIALPNTKTGSVSLKKDQHSRVMDSQGSLKSPIWIDGEDINNWAEVLVKIGVIDNPQTITEESPINIPSHSRFFAKTPEGTHLIHAASAESAVITYEQVEKANTQLDTLQLASCIIVTLGSFTSGARILADSLKRKKNLQILDGEGISERLKDLSIFSSCNEMFSEFDRKFSLTPLITAGKVAALVVDEVQNSWYSIVSPTGDILAESDRFVGLLKEKLPHLRRMSIRTLSGAYRESNKDVFEEFDREEYIKRCLSLYDTANYPGLASVGVHMPIKSLRRIYVPTSANVEQQQSAIEATERAIDELVETLGLDEHQREQLTKQMKARYGSQKTTEVGAASKLYQNFSNLLVLGDPGSGKTCLVRAEMMSYCTSDDEKDRSWYGSHVPIFLPLAEYLYSIDTPLPLLKQCVSHARDQGLSITSTQMDDLLSRGRVAFFFDGLDEVGSIRARQKVIDEITNLVEQYAQAGNRFVLTSRPAAVRDISLPIELSRVSLLGLTDSEIQLLVNRLFKARYEKGTSLTEKDKDVIRTYCEIVKKLRA